jgi:methyl-accepting chemotaxis protein
MNPDGLTEYQIQLVEESFAEAAPHGAALAAKFFRRLVHNFPEAKEVFADFDEHVVQKRLLGALVLMVENLRTPEKLQPALDQWGVFHQEHQVESSFYWAVGSTLLRTLAEFTGDLWGSELEEAWSAAYTDVSRRMIASAEAATV